MTVNNLKDGIIHIVQRNWRGDIDDPESKTSKRPLTLGNLVDRYHAKAAVAEGCDFPGLGPHSFRRANITWRQEFGGSSIEASKIAGHSTVRMTEGYTKIQLNRQAELTRLIQEKLASVGEQPRLPSVTAQELADVEINSTLVQ